MFRCSMFCRKPRTGPPLHRVLTIPPLRPAASLHPFDVGCSDVPMFDVPPQTSHRATTSPSPHNPTLRPAACGLLHPFDVGCSDVPMFDVLPQTSHRATTSPSPHNPTPAACGLPACFIPSMLDVLMFRCSTFRRKPRTGPPLHRVLTIPPLRPAAFIPSMLDVLMFRCSTFRRKPRTGPPLHRVLTIPPLRPASSLRCWMF